MFVTGRLGVAWAGWRGLAQLWRRWRKAAARAHAHFAYVSLSVGLAAWRDSNRTLRERRARIALAVVRGLRGGRTRSVARAWHAWAAQVPPRGGKPSQRRRLPRDASPPNHSKGQPALPPAKPPAPTSLLRGGGGGGAHEASPVAAPTARRPAATHENACPRPMVSAATDAPSEAHALAEFRPLVNPPRPSPPVDSMHVVYDRKRSTSGVDWASYATNRCRRAGRPTNNPASNPSRMPAMVPFGAPTAAVAAVGLTPLRAAAPAALRHSPPPRHGERMAAGAEDGTVDGDMGRLRDSLRARMLGQVTAAAPDVAPPLPSAMAPSPSAVPGPPAASHFIASPDGRWRYASYDVQKEIDQEAMEFGDNIGGDALGARGAQAPKSAAAPTAAAAAPRGHEQLNYTHRVDVLLAAASALRSNPLPTYTPAHVPLTGRDGPRSVHERPSERQPASARQLRPVRPAHQPTVPAFLRADGGKKHDVAYWDAEHLDDVYTTGDRPPKTPPYQQVQKPSRQRVVSTVLRTGGGKKRDPAYWDPEHLATIHSP